MATEGCGEQIILGESQGVTVERQITDGGMVLFDRLEGRITVNVFQAREPDVPLNEVAVFAVAEQVEGEFTGRYVVMVEDPYWGRRIQPAVFTAPPFTENVSMGYRLCGNVLSQGVPLQTAYLSLEVDLWTLEDGGVTAWDLEEYNVLVWSRDQETYVAGSEVRTPLTLQANGYWEWFAPRGHGAIYQRETDRRDDTAQTAAVPLTRYVSAIYVMYLGRKVPVAEGHPGDLDLQNGTLVVTGTPGATVRVGVEDDGGAAYTVPTNGTLTVTHLPTAEINLVQYQLTPTGEWDTHYGCPRLTTTVRETETTTVTLAPLDYYADDSDIVCGRIYLAPGVPAAGMTIHIVSPESGEEVGQAGPTDGNGFWSVYIPPEGLGGYLYILDETWGSMRILGMPYTDVVLGARAYAWWTDDLRPEAWRKDTYGYKNFTYVGGSVVVVDPDTNRVYQTGEAPYGGWITLDYLPKYKYQSVADLFRAGPVLKSYQLLCDGVVVDPGVHLGSQPLSNFQLEADNYRASGYFLQRKLLMGGKIKHNTAVLAHDAIVETWPEAARVGLEFGDQQWYTEVRSGEPQHPRQWTCFTDLVCPYCGGPVNRGGKAIFTRGFCEQCALAWGDPRSTDGRGCARSVTVAGGGQIYAERGVVLSARGGFSNPIQYHWRPDLYEENDTYLDDAGPGMRTNAPRWWAEHVHQVGDTLGLGTFNSDINPPFRVGHDLAYYASMMGREVGLAQFKLAFPPGWVIPQDFTLDLDCVRVDAVVETVRVTVPRGTCGPSATHPLGQVVPLTWTPKLRAEAVGSPYIGVGLYTHVQDIRLVDPPSAPNLRCVVTTDVPFLHDTAGVEVQTNAATPVALQLWQTLSPCHPHLMEDAVGQLFLFRVREGNIVMRRRRSLTVPWEPEWTITRDGISDYPWGAKDEAGIMTLVRQVGDTTTDIAQSRDDGLSWEEV